MLSHKVTKKPEVYLSVESFLMAANEKVFMMKGKFETQKLNEAQPLSNVTDAELLTSAPFCINTMLSAADLSSDGDQVSAETICNTVPADQFSRIGEPPEAEKYKYKYNIEVRSKKDLGINMGGLSKIIIFKSD